MANELSLELMRTVERLLKAFQVMHSTVLWAMERSESDYGPRVKHDGYHKADSDDVIFRHNGSISNVLMVFGSNEMIEIDFSAQIGGASHDRRLRSRGIHCHFDDQFLRLV